MAQIIIDIPNNADATRALDAFAARFGYQAIVPDGSGGTMANPQTKAQFAKLYIANWIKQIVSENESNSAAETARQAAINNANNLNIT